MAATAGTGEENMFTHMTIGTNDLKRAEKFYDAVMTAIGNKNLGKMNENATMYGKQSPQFIVLKPVNGLPATSANGGTIGFAAPNRAAVHAFHEAGLKNGGTDEGKPGPRAFTPTAYASYLRDPDGNKICTYCFAKE
jgi:catechol 2,3-dioxygenase-like lactoylglutathione lyase family enzyme